MNNKQEKILITAATVIFFILIYPPFQLIHPRWGGVFQGHSWIFEPSRDAAVDITLLLTQWLGVLIIGSIAYLIAWKK